eukprot:TRINITY_DN72890_c0_g1_i1.p1 TRINITY_DN72890_c0_g1~~TRINITY_DN72890_c0_g1_i1.p1  ORF type:complete len:570 (+),score=176.22 TRINITY_DN72890_c0_g1_i1:203-1711(+)
MNPAISTRHCSLRWEHAALSGGSKTDAAMTPHDGATPQGAGQDSSVQDSSSGYPSVGPEFTFYLKDLSTNGVFVNSKRLGKNLEVVLKEGDLVQLVRAKSERQDWQKYQMGYTFVPKVVEAQRAVTRDVRADYLLDEGILGKGAFAVVRLGTNKQTGHRAAVKIINLKKAEIHARQGQGQKQQAVFLKLSQPQEDAKPKKPVPKVETARDKQMREIDILKKLNHPNTIRIYEVYLSETECHIVMELATGGDLFHLIKKRGALPPADSLIVFQQLIYAVEYLHDNGIAHRDIKPENILLGEPDDLTQIKLSDFGLAKNFGSQVELKTTVGTPMYAAPEVVHREYDPDAVQQYRMQKEFGFENPEKPEPKPYTPAVDIWSCGVVLWVMLTARAPFPRVQRNNRQTTQNNYAAGLDFTTPPMPRVSPHLKALIRSMVQPVPTERATIPQILENFWFKGVDAYESRPSAAEATLPSEPAGSPGHAADSAKPSDTGVQPLKRRRTVD